MNKHLAVVLTVFLSLLTYIKADSDDTILCMDNEGVGAMFTIALLLVFAVCVGITYLLSAKFNHIPVPPSVVTILIGVIFGAILLILPFNNEELSRLDPSIFFRFILPIIIFNASYNLNKKHFFANIDGILLISIIGTIISTIVVGCGLFLISLTGLTVELSILDALIFGSLISAIDPVAILGVFTSLKVNSTLHNLMLGESIVNDAIAIALFGLFHSLKLSPDLSAGSIVLNIFLFILAPISSLALGIFFGFLAAFFSRYVKIKEDNTAIEVTIFFLFAYIPYLLAMSPILHMSGIVTLLTSSILMSTYVTPNLSRDAQDLISQMSHLMSFVSETFTFLYIGISVFLQPLTTHWSVTLIFATLFLCLVGRVINIFPLTALINLRRSKKVGIRDQVVMMLSGLRGAIAVALAINIRREGGDYIFTTTMVVVLVTTVAFGSLSYPLVRLLKIENQREESEVDQEQENRSDQSFLVRHFSRLNERYFSRWFKRTNEMNEFMQRQEVPLEEEEGRLELRDDHDDEEDQQNKQQEQPGADTVV